MTTLTDNKNNSLNLAFDSIDSCFGYIDYITSKIHQLLAFYNSGEIDRANSTLVELIDLMDLYIQLVTKIYQVLRSDLKEKKFKTNDVQELEMHLLTVLKALLQAREKEDIIMLCDLLEYELIDNLIQWKIKILPELKKLKGL